LFEHYLLGKVASVLPEIRPANEGKEAAAPLPEEAGDSS
jgi:hypothetical protein